MMKTLVIYNPAAGDGRGEETAMYFKQAAEKMNFGPVSLAATKEDQDVAELAAQAGAGGCELVVASGGDGTLSEVVCGLQQSKTPPALGIIPAGTVNNLARVLGLPLDREKAINTILTGHPVAIDIGQVNDRYMVSTLTIGLLADIGDAVSQEEKNTFGPLAFAKNALPILGENRLYDLHFELDEGVSIDAATPIALIAMTGSVGGLKHFNTEAKPNDGFFHLFILPELSPGTAFNLVGELLSGDFQNAPEVAYYKTRTLTIAGPQGEEIRARVDGDPGPCLPLTMSVGHNAQRVIVPTRE